MLCKTVLNYLFTLEFLLINIFKSILLVSHNIQCLKIQNYTNNHWLNVYSGTLKINEFNKLTIRNNYIKTNKYRFCGYVLK